MKRLRFEGETFRGAVVFVAWRVHWHCISRFAWFVWLLTNQRLLQKSKTVSVGAQFKRVTWVAWLQGIAWDSLTNFGQNLRRHSLSYCHSIVKLGRLDFIIFIVIISVGNMICACIESRPSSIISGVFIYRVFLHLWCWSERCSWDMSLQTNDARWQDNRLIRGSLLVHGWLLLVELYAILGLHQQITGQESAWIVHCTRPIALVKLTSSVVILLLLLHRCNFLVQGIDRDNGLILFGHLIITSYFEAFTIDG